MSRAAIRYAKAILEIAQSTGNTTAVNADMLLVVATVNENEELKTFLLNPTIKGDHKFAALNSIFAAVQPTTKSLFQLLLANKRFEILTAIALEYNSLLDELNGVEVAKVTTAIAMTAELEQQILSKIKTFSNKSITLENVVDPAIIGGFVLRIGDKQYNASVANRLQQLKREFSY